MARVVVVGAGRQGLAAAYDLAAHLAGESIVIADFDLSSAKAACDRVNTLLGREACVSAAVDAADQEGLVEFLSRFDLAVAAAPYRLNPDISNAGIQTGCNVVDMGVDTPDALAIHARSDEAQQRAISVITDCGVAPGLVNILAYKLLNEHPETVSIKLYCGGLPQTALAPYFHKVGFSVDSLLGEYVDEVDSLKDGQVVRTEALEDFESLCFRDFGILEAVTTSGGTGTAPHHLQGRLRDYEYKTLRHPGHWSAMLFMRDAGLWSEEAIEGVGVPRDLTLALMERHMVEADYHDVVVARVVSETASGSFGYDLVDRFDPETGFTAMQRTTGFSTSIIALAVLDGLVPKGCMACEVAVEPDTFFAKAQERGIEITSLQG